MTDALLAGDLPLPPRPDYLRDRTTMTSWLTTTDHKRIAILYAITITIFFFMGGAAITLVRLELFTPNGGLLTSDTYNKLFSFHGIVMVWFFLVPSIPNTMGNFLLPLMIGAPDVAFPRLNLFSWYLTIAAGALTVYALIAGGVDTGWTFYTPYSTMFSNSHVLAAAAGVFVVGFASIATGVNFIATTHMLRAPGMTWFRLPLFVWAIYATSIIMVLATPVLAISLLLVIAERWLGLPIFDPANGGDPILFQHLFWFYSHPAVYIMVLPAMGVVSEIIPCFARRRIFGYDFMVYAMIAIAGIGFFVWGHHMFVSGQSPYANLIFSFLSFIIAVPSAIKVFNWTASLYRGHISFEAPMLYALGFVGLFTTGGLSGLFLASIPVDVHVTDTYFRGRAFSLHHGRRFGVGILRRPAFLVAEDNRQDVSGILGALRRHPDVRRLQHDLSAAILRRLSRHAPALPHVSARIPALQRDVFVGRSRPGGRLSSSARLFRLVALLRPSSRQQSVGRDRPGMDHILASAAQEFRSSAARRPRSLRLPRRRTIGRARSPRGAERAGSPMTDTSGLLREPWEYFERQRDAGKFGIWVFLASEVLFFGALMLTYTVCRIDHPDRRSPPPGAKPISGTAPINTTILLTSSLTMAVASQAAVAGPPFSPV